MLSLVLKSIRQPKAFGVVRRPMIHYNSHMSTQDLAEAVMELPEKERLELARRIVASLIDERDSSEQVLQAVRGIEDVVTGKVPGLTEAQFRDALK